MEAEPPPPLHHRERDEGGVRRAEPGRLVREVVDAEDVDEDVVDRADPVRIHPRPQEEDQRARDHRRDQQDQAVCRPELPAAHAVEEHGGHHRQEDHPRQEDRREDRRVPEPGSDERVLEGLDVVVEPDPLRRLRRVVEQEAEARERDPESAEDRPELPAHEEDERRHEIRPRAHEARRRPPDRLKPCRRAGGGCPASHRPVSPRKKPSAPRGSR